MYRRSAPLTSLVPLERTRVAARSMAEALSMRLLLNVKANTPVGPVIDMPGFTQTRKPGTLREAIYALPPLPIMEGWSIVVATDDPIAPYVEWDTQPHMIYPRYASVLAWADVKAGGMAFASAVHHPGTSGQHMFAIGVLITEAEMEAVCRPIMDAWASSDVLFAEGEGGVSTLSMQQAVFA